MTEKIDLRESFVGNSVAQINNYEIRDNYIYEYKYCKNNSCRILNDVVSSGYASNKIKTTLLILDTKTSLDKETTYAKNMKSINNFYEDFFTVEYDGQEVSTKNVTPKNLKDKIVLQTTAEIKNTNNLKLVITIRDKIYKIVLKGE